MINFENSLNTAKHLLLAWSSYAKLTEITLVRDAKGQISIYLMPKSKPKIDSDELRAITNTLAKTLGSFFSGTLFIENAEEWTKDLFKKIRELRIEDPNPPATTTSPKWYLIERGIAKKHGFSVHKMKIPHGPMNPHSLAVKKHFLKLSLFTHTKAEWEELLH